MRDSNVAFCRLLKRPEHANKPPPITSNIAAFRKMNRRIKYLDLTTGGVAHESARQIQGVLKSFGLRQRLIAPTKHVRQSSCAAVAARTYMIYQDVACRSVGLDCLSLNAA